VRVPVDGMTRPGYRATGFTALAVLLPALVVAVLIGAVFNAFGEGTDWRGLVLLAVALITAVQVWALRHVTRRTMPFAAIPLTVLNLVAGWSA
jgi:hypothetical protein